MTTEDDFQKALDANPADHQTRLVFADWLQERDDPRAEGYRALGTLALWATDSDAEPGAYAWFDAARCDPHSSSEAPRHQWLPSDWYALLLGGLQTVGRAPINVTRFFDYVGKWLDWFSRREADDAAALAFSRLPVARRSELLATDNHTN